MTTIQPYLGEGKLLGKDYVLSMVQQARTNRKTDKSISFLRNEDYNVRPLATAEILDYLQEHNEAILLLCLGDGPEDELHVDLVKAYGSIKSQVSSQAALICTDIDDKTDDPACFLLPHMPMRLIKGAIALEMAKNENAFTGVKKQLTT